MTDRAAALAGWASRAVSWLRTPSPRRDLALPLVVLAAQLTWAAVFARSALPLRSVHSGAVDWALLVTGPVALAGRRRHPVAVLWVTFASTFAPSGSPAALLSLSVAFVAAATTGYRYWAWLAIALRLGWAIWLAPLFYATAISPRDILLLAARCSLLAGWVLAVAVAAEAARIRAGRVAATRASRELDQRRRQSEERLRVARDLHDVTGHNISLINVQASMGLDLIDSQPEQAPRRLPRSSRRPGRRSGNCAPC